MTMAWEHEVRLYGREPEAGDGFVTARCTCGGWEETFSDSTALDTAGAYAAEHLATHPEPPRLCARAHVADTCGVYAQWTILHGPGDEAATTEACTGCLGDLVAACSAGDDMDGSVVVLPHPVYDGATLAAAVP